MCRNFGSNLGSTLDDFLKQRLLGAIAIIGLAVIFIPMLLDKDEASTLVDVMQIPPRPAALQSVDVPQVLADKREETEQQSIALPEPLEIKEDEISQQPIAAIKNELLADKAPTANDSELWVVQLGSFSKQANAIALRDRLLSNYPDLYIEEINVPMGVNYRLRLGDFANRETAISKRREIQAAFDVPSVVMAKE